MTVRELVAGETALAFEAMRALRAHLALLEWCADVAQRTGCATLQLASNVGPERQDAHRLYFTNGMRISSYHFTREL